MKFTDVKQAEEAIFAKLIEHNIFEDTKLPEAVALVVAGISSSSRGNYNANDTIAAAEYMETYLEANPNGFAHLAETASAPAAPAAGTTVVTTTTGKAKADTSFSAPKLSSAEAERRIAEQSKELIQSGVKRQVTASINAIIVANDPAVIKKSLEGKKVTVEYNPATFEKYDALVVPTEENLAKYNSIKARVQEGKEFDVHVGDSPGRIIGYRISYDDVQAGKSVPVSGIYPVSGIFDLLVTKLANRIPTNEEGVGVAYQRLYTPDSSKRQVRSSSEVAKPRLKWYGTTKAVKEGRLVEYANKPNGNTVVKSQPIAEEFLVYASADANDVKTDGTRKTRKVRLRGPVAGYPEFERKNAEMNDAFAPIASKDVLHAVSSAESKDEIAKAVQMLRAFSLGKAEVPDALADLAHEIRLLEAEAPRAVASVDTSDI